MADAVGTGLLAGADSKVPPLEDEGSSDPGSFLDKHLAQSQAKFDMMQKEAKRIGDIRKGLQSLEKLGDAVTSDDVLDEMAELVAHGADPKMFAAIMAGNGDLGVGPMPPQGQALAGWLGKISEEVLGPYEAQLRPAVALAGHQLGVAAMHKMVELGAKSKGGVATPGGAAAPPEGAPPPAPQASPLLQ